MTDDDPNEAYEVVPIEPGPHGPHRTWWTVKRNGLPVRHFPGKEKAELCATDPEYRASPYYRKSVGEGEGEMTANVLSKIFTIEIGDTPTLTFEVQNLREAQELCHEQWLKDDLAEAKSDGVPLWDGKAKLRARIALPDESALFAEANKNGQPADGLMLVYLVELDGGVTDEQSVDPGAFPPART
jgi:hypothetical protein